MTTLSVLGNDSVTNAKLANMAQATIKGRQAAAGTGDPEDLTAAQARTAMGLGTIATQDANNVSISGGAVTGITDLTVADGGTGRSSHTAYAVICGGTTGTAAQQSIAGVGTSGQVLTSNGASALPTFQDAGAGKLVALERKSGTGDVASLDFATGISSTYRTYKLIGWMKPATDQVALWVRGSDDGGSTYEADAADYSWENSGQGNAATFYATGDVSDSELEIYLSSTNFLIGNASNEKIDFEITFQNPSSAAFYKNFKWWFAYNRASDSVVMEGQGGGSMLAAAAMNAVRLLFSSGNIDEYDVTLYALANS